MDYDYTAQTPEEISLKAGDKVTILRQEGDWSYGAVGPRKGYFPTSYGRKVGTA